MTPLQVLLVTKSEELKRMLTTILIEPFGEGVVIHRVESLQDAIEKVEQKELIPGLVLIDQRSSGHSMLNLFFELLPFTGIVVICADQNIFGELSGLQTHARFILQNELENDLPVILRKFETVGKIENISKSSDDEYISVASDRILQMRPIPIDIYLRIHASKYVKVFRRLDEVISSDLTKYQGQTFFLKRTDCDQMLGEQARQMEALSSSEPVDTVKAKRVADMSQELVKNLVSEVGFTEEAQKIARASVNMSLKLIGSKPRLSSILTELKKKEGNFVTSHSFLLGQVACAMAYTVGWKSTSTYFKLSMAAFLHDIALNIHTHEHEATYEEAAESGFYSPEDLKILRFHASKASEYTRQFSEIPVDVEQIVAQHHERPNGSGYPRGLTAKYISPLSAVFILAHELILFMMKFPDAKVEKFYEIVENEFTQNPFRKIISELKTAAKSNEIV